MTFDVAGKTMCLKGDRSLGKSLISLKSMARELRRREGGVMVELNNVELNSNTPQRFPTSWEKY